MIFFIVSLIILAVILWFLYADFFGAGYQPTTDKSLNKMIEFARLKKKHVVYDLGCGDGKIIIKSAPFCKKAIGIEIDPVRYEISKLRTKNLKNVQIIRKDFFSHNLKDADVVFIFLGPRANARLKEKFLKEMKKGSLVVSYYWKMDLPVWKKDDKLKVYAYNMS